MEIINLGFLAHVDAGKTTTTEQLLYKSGGIKNAGSIENKNTQTDWLPIERERGISVKASSAIIMHNEMKINLIDTPGHMDFVGEVERSLSALDAVVLIISAKEGIQAQTEVLWRAVKSLSLPVLIFVNKIDRDGCDLNEILNELSKKLSKNIIPLNFAENEGTKEVKVRKNDFSEENLLLIAENDEKIAEMYFSGENIPKGLLLSSLKAQTEKRILFPLVFGSAALGEGIDLLLDIITTMLPKALNNDEAAPSGTVFKIEHSKTMGKIAHIRLFEGNIKNRDTIKIIRGRDELTEKITQIRSINGSKHDDTGILRSGDIAAVFGLSNAKTGDIIGELTNRLNCNITSPLFSVQVNCDNKTELLKAVRELSDEDPFLDYEWEPSERELWIKIMGAIQLEILTYLFKERYNLDVTFTPPSVIYKETPSKTAIGYERYTMPKPCWAVVELLLEPLKRGSGFLYESKVSNNDIFIRYQNHIEAVLPEALKQGMYNWEVTDLKITLTGGEHHIMHTHPMDFFLATPVAVMDGLRNAETTLLEPILKMDIIADEAFSGKIIGDILSMRGEFDNPVISSGNVYFEAHVPVAGSMGYPTDFSSMTGGKGSIKTRFSHYKECDVSLGKIAKRRGVNPLDRAKWILYKRNVL